MVVEVSPKIRKEIFDIVNLYGYRSAKEFIEDALRRRILDLKKTEFLKRAKVIKEKLGKRGLTERDILEDFDKFYHQK